MEPLVATTGSQPSFASCGDFSGRWKWSSCAALPDGRVLFVPLNASSILLFSPTGNTWEEVGHFEGVDKWRSCAVLPDGRVLFVPYSASSILLFSPTGNTWEEVGHFEGGCKWSSCAVLPDGRVLFVPFKASSILLFSPTGNTWEEVGHFEGDLKWSSCAVLPDGKVVLVPGNASEIIVAQHASWHMKALPRKREDQAWEMTWHMWTHRAFADAEIECGTLPGSKKLIPVHRAVLASRSAVFERMFLGSFLEARAARVSLPEDPAVVGAVLEHTYTGVLPPVDPLLVLPLAHRLGLHECVVASAAAIDQSDPADAVWVLATLLGDPAVDSAWARLKHRICHDANLMDVVLLGSVGFPAGRNQAIKTFTSVAVQTDELTSSEPQPSRNDENIDGGEDEDNADGDDDLEGDDPDGGDRGSLLCPSPRENTSDSVNHGGFKNASLAVGARQHGHQHAPTSSWLNASMPDNSNAHHKGGQLSGVCKGMMCQILHFSRPSRSIVNALQKTELGRNLTASVSNLQPNWARGAIVLVEELTDQAMHQSGVAPADLRPWNVVLRMQDVPRLRQALQASLSCRQQRPRTKASKTRHFVLAHGVAQVVKGSKESRELQETLTERTFYMTKDGPPGLTQACAEEEFSLPDGIMAGAEVLSKADSTTIADLQHISESLPNVESPLEAPTIIDEETAARIQHEQWASAVEERIKRSGLRTLLPVQNTFVHYQDTAPSPRTVCTA